MSLYHAPLPVHEQQLEKAVRAFHQNPTPALANSIARLKRAIKTQRKGST